MRVENDILYIDEELSDEVLDEFTATVKQDGIEKIKVLTPNLGASIVQMLLVEKQDKAVEIEDGILKKIFENVLYKTVE